MTKPNTPPNAKRLSPPAHHDAAVPAIRLTRLRRMVLDQILRSPVPVKAYDLIDALTQAAGRRLSPPTMYRSLDYLVRHGVISRIESRNAYVAPRRPGQPKLAALYCLCADCGKAIEPDDAPVIDRIAKAAAFAGFVVEKCVVEARGTCGACAPGSARPPAPSEWVRP